MKRSKMSIRNRRHVPVCQTSCQRYGKILTNTNSV